MGRVQAILAIDRAFACDARLDPSGKTGRIAADIERCLMLGEFQFGQRITSAQLASRFHASRQPLSGAIAHLRALGFVEVIPQVGCRIVAPSEQEVTDFFFAMARVEAMAASFAALRYEGDEAERLIEIAGRERPDELASFQARVRYIQNLEDFHAQLWAMARSGAIQPRIASMRRLGSFYLWRGGLPMIPASAYILIAERIEIAHAIAERKAGKAEILMERHIAHKPTINALNR